MPPPARTARILLWINIALTGLAVVFLTLLAIAASSQGPGTGLGLLFLVMVLSVIPLVLTIVLTARIASRRRWVRVGLIVLMAVNIVGYLLNMVNGGPPPPGSLSRCRSPCSSACSGRRAAPGSTSKRDESGGFYLARGL